MVLTLDGNSELGAPVTINLGNLVFSRYFIRYISVTNGIYFLRRTEKNIVNI